MYWIPIDRSLGRAALLEVRGGRPGAAVEVAVVAPVIEESPAKRTAGELEDALRTFPADEVLVFESDEGHTRWLEDGLLERAREILDRPLRLAGASDNAATWPRSRSASSARSSRSPSSPPAPAPREAPAPRRA
jgi:hypothetical protein